MPCLLPGRWRNRARTLICLGTYVGFGPNRVLDGLPYRRDCFLTGEATATFLSSWSAREGLGIPQAF
jgi:hypothetical protein